MSLLLIDHLSTFINQTVDTIVNIVKGLVCSSYNIIRNVKAFLLSTIEN